MTKKRVFSGTRATGRLHIGNYLGAIKGYIDLQQRDDLDCIYMVVDLHSITTPFDKKTLGPLTQEVVLDYLAAGLDPQKSIVTLQSLVPQHAYLSWLFSALTTQARLQHLPTFKEKIALHPENVTLALFSYPVLMAADMLLYNAELVPVGQDQEPHLEIAREVARKSNQLYGTNFPEPQRFATPVNSVPSLAGTGKMSKSVAGSTVFLTDSLSDIENKIKKIPTNSGNGSIKTKSRLVGGKKVNFKEYLDENKEVSPGVDSLFQFVELFKGSGFREEYEAAYTSNNGLRFGDIKKELALAIYNDLEPLQERRRDLALQKDLVKEVLLDGAARAQEKAQPTLEAMKDAMGFWKST